MAYLHTGSPGRPVFGAQTLAAAGGRPEELAAVSIGTALAEGADGAGVQAVGVACRDQTQAGAVRAALAGQRIGNCRLVPEVAASLRMLERSGELGDHSTLVFYDLGSSGLTVTVVERTTGAVLGTARTDRISGDLVDRLIRDHDTIVVPGHFFQAPQHIRIAFGGRTEMLREAVRRLDLTLRA